MQNKTKALLPSLKNKKRYIAFEIITDNKLLLKQPLNNTINELNQKLGLIEASKAGIMPVKYDVNTQIGILKNNNKYTDKIKTMMGMITELGTQETIINPIKVSGTIKGLNSIQNKN